MVQTSSGRAARALASALAALAVSASAQYVYITQYPAMGTANPWGGLAVNLPLAPANVKAVLLVCGPCTGNIMWWDKMHSRFLNLGVSDPGDAQGAGIPIASNGTWYWDDWASSPNDNVANLMRFFVVPTSFVTTWPQYQVRPWTPRGNGRGRQIV
jgi:hypothetical protein